mmetsp:Transcript_54522/g.144053  ORF Transcript_54522/g.144053 Transcript_54522/m.144053 type:complete len:229 (-) Transcript_54522:1609-2295(-)
MENSPQSVPIPLLTVEVEGRLVVRERSERLLNAWNCAVNVGQLPVVHEFLAPDVNLVIVELLQEHVVEVPLEVRDLFQGRQQLGPASIDHHPDVKNVLWPCPACEWVERESSFTSLPLQANEHNLPSTMLLIQRRDERRDRVGECFVVHNLGISDDNDTFGAASKCLPLCSGKTITRDHRIVAPREHTTIRTRLSAKVINLLGTQKSRPGREIQIRGNRIWVRKELFP